MENMHRKFTARMSTTTSDLTFPQPLSTVTPPDNNWNQYDNEVTDVPALFRCNACYIKFTEEEALEDHILALHSSGNPLTEAENLNKCKITSAMKYSITHDTKLPLNKGTSENEVLSHGENKEKFIPGRVLLKIPSPEQIRMGPPVLQPILTADKKFKCNLCEKMFTRKESLQYHFFCHTGEKPFKCNQCGASFRAKPTLRNHMKVVHNGKTNNCEEMASVTQVKTNKATYICSLCSKRFKNKFRLNLHMHTQHGDLPFECSVCLKKFPIISRLEVHMRLHTDGQIYTKSNEKLVSNDKGHTRLNEEKPYSCDICKKTFGKKVNLHNHVLQHKEHNQLFRCSVCNETFETEAAVRDHMSAHIAKKPPLNSLTLSKEFHQSNSLNVQNNSTSFQCTMCDSSFPHQSRLKTHMLKYHQNKNTKKNATSSTTQNVKPKATTKVINWRLVARKNHVCPQCGRKFTMEKNLQTHVTYTHSEGEMRYQCSKCDKSFHYNCRLKLHILKAHKS